MAACALLLSLACAAAAPGTGQGAGVAPAASSRNTADGTSLTIYSSTSERFAHFLVEDFTSRHPEIKVRYVALPPLALDARMRREVGTTEGPDVIWSSAMDLQMKAARDGLALAYRSPEAATLPSWGKWKDQLYATTYEPVVLVYNRRFVPTNAIPTTHRALAQALAAGHDRYQGKVTTYDLDNPEVGAVPFHADAVYDPGFWTLVRALGSVALDTRESSGAMLDRIASGESLIAYNVAGNEAIRRARRDPSIGVQFTLDYNVVLTRPMFISRSAPHPDAARLWMDYALSQKGQQQMQIADLIPIREDVNGIDPGLVMLRRAGRIARPVALDDKLAQSAAPARVREFQRRWASAVRVDPGRVSQARRQHPKRVARRIPALATTHA